MQTSTIASVLSGKKFPPFDLARLLRTVFNPKQGQKLCILIDYEEPEDIHHFAFLNKEGYEIQKRAYNFFYQPLRQGLMQELGLKACDFFAYQATGGSNLELPSTALTPEGKSVSFQKEIYPAYDLILCISTFSATAPLTASAKKFGFRGATMHGMNDAILQTGLAVDYNDVSRLTEKLRQGLTRADSVEIEFELDHTPYHLDIELGRQEAQKSHGICREGPDIANLPAGEVYFVPVGGQGTFPIKFDDGTIALMDVSQGKVHKVNFVRGNPRTIAEIQDKFHSDPASAVLGELGFGTQILPHSGRDIQDEKIFGTFHLATGRNDHLNGSVTLDRFANKHNATHDDILFSPFKTPEIHVRQVSMHRQGKKEVLIENYEPAAYLWKLLQG